VQNYHLRFGKRVAFPATIEILDALDSGYRAKLVQQKRQRPSPPSVIGLPALTPGALRSGRTPWTS
jgi:hypothetical protein